MTRATDKPIGTITLSGYGVTRAAGAVHWYLEYEGPQVVFVDADGRVFALRDGTLLADAWLAHHVEWLVGRYDRSGSRQLGAFAARREQLVGDIYARLQELRQVRAA